MYTVTLQYTAVVFTLHELILTAQTMVGISSWSYDTRSVDQLSWTCSFATFSLKIHFAYPEVEISIFIGDNDISRSEADISRLVDSPNYFLCSALFIIDVSLDLNNMHTKYPNNLFLRKHISLVTANYKICYEIIVALTAILS